MRKERWDWRRRRKEKDKTLDEDLLKERDNRSPEEEGVGVVGLWIITGESETASSDLLEGEEESSSVLGT